MGESVPAEVIHPQCHDRGQRAVQADRSTVNTAYCIYAPPYSMNDIHLMTIVKRSIRIAFQLKQEIS